MSALVAVSWQSFTGRSHKIPRDQTWPSTAFSHQHVLGKMFSFAQWRIKDLPLLTGVDMRCSHCVTNSADLPPVTIFWPILHTVPAVVLWHRRNERMLLLPSCPVWAGTVLPLTPKLHSWLMLQLCFEMEGLISVWGEHTSSLPRKLQPQAHI